MRKYGRKTNEQSSCTLYTICITQGFRMLKVQIMQIVQSSKGDFSIDIFLLSSTEKKDTKTFYAPFIKKRSL